MLAYCMTFLFSLGRYGIDICSLRESTIDQKKDITHVHLGKSVSFLGLFMGNVLLSRYRKRAVELKFPSSLGDDSQKLELHDLPATQQMIEFSLLGSSAGLSLPNSS